MWLKDALKLNRQSKQLTKNGIEFLAPAPALDKGKLESRIVNEDGHPLAVPFVPECFDRT